MILTPVTLWKDFDDSLPLDEEIVSERRADGVVFRDLYFYGRRTQEGRVKIFARYVFPEGEEEFPAVMILFEEGFPFDESFIMRFIRNGYGVLCVDYCGENPYSPYTIYPDDVDYGNYVRAGEHLEKAEPTAKETSWYEWAGVARYAARYLNERKEVTRAGAIGLRTGGEVLFKIAPYAPLSCMIAVCAAGWLAYRDIEKFSDEKHEIFSEERHRFIAGIDSQSYAPYVKCPVLLLSAINDKKCTYDRVYDTFKKINPEVEKAILFSAHGNGLIGSHSLVDLDLFLDKYLKDRSVFISGPASVNVADDGNGNLVARCEFDNCGEIKDYGIFYTEKVTDSETRDWTRILGNPADLDDNVGTVPLSFYRGSKKALVYAFVNYTNNFSVTSKICEVTMESPYANSCPKNRVLYSSADGYNGFSVFRRHTQAVADCFIDGTGSEVRLLPGYGGIMGISSRSGLVSFRVGEPRYEPNEGASLCFDAYSKTNAVIKITFFFDADEKSGYTAEVKIEGCGKWKNVVLNPDDFKSDTGLHLSDYKGAVSMLLYSDEEVLYNNVLWI